jgi:hypothetical protein
VPPATTIPTPVVAFTKWGLWFHDYVNHYLDAGLDWIAGAAAETDTWRKVYLRYRWTGSVDIKDDMFMTIDISNITAGAIDNSWTTADYTTMEGKLDTFVTAAASLQNSNMRMVEYRWYVQSFNPPSNVHPFAPHGPPERVTVKSITGSGGNTAQQIPQASMAVTLKTLYPRNWGRNYLPGLNMQLSGVPPQFTSAQVDSFANAYNTLVSSSGSSDFQIVVPITQLGVGRRGESPAGSVNRRLTSVTGIAVDSAPDVIRRRHVHLAAYKKSLP